MGKILNCGLLKSHDRKLGIQHKYIVKELTIDNWNKRAIVREGKYIYILKCKCSDSSETKKKTIYLIDGLSKSNTFDTLNEALLAANNHSDSEGEYPKERGNPIHIAPVMVFPHLREKYLKDKKNKVK